MPTNKEIKEASIQAARDIIKGIEVELGNYDDIPDDIWEEIQKEIVLKTDSLITLAEDIGDLWKDIPDYDDTGEIVFMWIVSREGIIWLDYIGDISGWSGVSHETYPWIASVPLPPMSQYIDKEEGEAGINIKPLDKFGVAKVPMDKVGQQQDFQVPAAKAFITETRKKREALGWVSDATLDTMGFWQWAIFYAPEEVRAEEGRIDRIKGVLEAEGYKIEPQEDVIVDTTTKAVFTKEWYINQIENWIKTEKDSGIGVGSELEPAWKDPAEGPSHISPIDSGEEGQFPEGWDPLKSEPWASPPVFLKNEESRAAWDFLQQPWGKWLLNKPDALSKVIEELNKQGYNIDIPVGEEAQEQAPTVPPADLTREPARPGISEDEKDEILNRLSELQKQKREMGLTDDEQAEYDKLSTMLRSSNKVLNGKVKEIANKVIGKLMAYKLDPDEVYMVMDKRGSQPAVLIVDKGRNEDVLYELYNRYVVAMKGIDYILTAKKSDQPDNMIIRKEIYRKGKSKKFKVGDKVKLVNKGYTDIPDNPVWGGENGKVIGEIIDDSIWGVDQLPSDREYEVKVEWENGTENIYRDSDLDFVDDMPQITPLEQFGVAKIGQVDPITQLEEEIATDPEEDIRSRIEVERTETGYRLLLRNSDMYPTGDQVRQMYDELQAEYRIPNLPVPENIGGQGARDWVEMEEGGYGERRSYSLAEVNRVYNTLPRERQINILGYLARYSYAQSTSDQKQRSAVTGLIVEAATAADAAYLETIYPPPLWTGAQVGHIRSVGLINWLGADRGFGFPTSRALRNEAKNSEERHSQAYRAEIARVAGVVIQGEEDRKPFEDGVKGILYGVGEELSAGEVATPVAAHMAPVMARWDITAGKKEASILKVGQTKFKVGDRVRINPDNPEVKYGQTVNEAVQQIVEKNIEGTIEELRDQTWVDSRTGEPRQTKFPIRVHWDAPLDRRIWVNENNILPAGGPEIKPLEQFGQAHNGSAIVGQRAIRDSKGNEIHIGDTVETVEGPKMDPLYRGIVRALGQLAPKYPATAVWSTWGKEWDGTIIPSSMGGTITYILGKDLLVVSPLSPEIKPLEQFGQRKQKEGIGEKLGAYDESAYYQGEIDYILKEGGIADREYIIEDDTELMGIWEAAARTNPGEHESPVDPDTFYRQVREAGLWDRFEELVKTEVWKDSDGLTFYWDMVKDNLTELMAERSDGNDWLVSGEHLGWQNRAGQGEVTAETGGELIQKIIPQTDVTFYIYDYMNGQGLAINNYHHDAPTGEWYYIMPKEPKDQIRPLEQFGSIIKGMETLAREGDSGGEVLTDKNDKEDNKRDRKRDYTEKKIKPDNDGNHDHGAGWDSEKGNTDGKDDMAYNRLNVATLQLKPGDRVRQIQYIEPNEDPIVTIVKIVEDRRESDDVIIHHRHKNGKDVEFVSTDIRNGITIDDIFEPIEPGIVPLEQFGVAKVGQVVEVEGDEPTEPEEGDIVTEDYLHWYQDGKLYVTGDEKDVEKQMNIDGFWPNVWWVSDHGNAHLVNLNKDYGEIQPLETFGNIRTGMRLVDLIEQYVNGRIRGNSSAHTIMGDVLYSYDTPIAVRVEGKIYMNPERYSVSTSRAQNLLKQYGDTEVSDYGKFYRLVMDRKLPVGRLRELEEGEGIVPLEQFGATHVLGQTALQVGDKVMIINPGLNIRGAWAEAEEMGATKFKGIRLMDDPDYWRGKTGTVIGTDPRENRDIDGSRVLVDIDNEDIEIVIYDNGLDVIEQAPEVPKITPLEKFGVRTRFNRTYDTNYNYDKEVIALNQE